MRTPDPSRRRFLHVGGLAVLGVAAGACGADDATTAASTTTPAPAPAITPVPASRALTGADFAGLGTCRLTPASTAGPFPLDEQFDRRDITEGVPGHPMRLGLRVVDSACGPVAGAAVEVWHTDATGDYSAFRDGGGGKDDAEGTTFCRGTQTTDAEGIVEFQTVYPGWYPGRAIHIHLRVRVDDRLVLTGQVYFDDAYSAAVMGAGEYAAFGLPDTTNATDGIAGDPAADGTLLAAVDADTSAGAGTLALGVLGVPT